MSLTGKTNCRQTIPNGQLILGKSIDPPKRGPENGVIFRHTFFDPKMELTTFRKFMVRQMRYRPEWLTGDKDVAAVFQKHLLNLKWQQYYGGGELEYKPPKKKKEMTYVEVPDNSFEARIRTYTYDPQPTVPPPEQPEE